MNMKTNTNTNTNTFQPTAKLPKHAPVLTSVHDDYSLGLTMDSLPDKTMTVNNQKRETLEHITAKAEYLRNFVKKLCDDLDG